MTVDKFAWHKAAGGVRLSKTARLVLGDIYDKSNGDGTGAIISVDSLMRKHDKSERTVKYALSELRKSGLVERTKQGRQFSGPSVYRLTMPAPQTESGCNYQGATLDSQGATFQGAIPETGCNPVAPLPDPYPVPLRGTGSRDPIVDDG